ncbi:Methylated-DNA-[protein]-cysteine S-methyltransferase [Nitrospira japonica]|uniref:methylated-DNA--[protein]-cysteine S-methyltransferase n=1 Tax=Nitrospira japonica TaxID=1325564 RepID=A0A1W1I284_9BACT|nr:methylated-DNA--[protein]-cysteine S-methyltransferase [Nitrospira japonica]SLM47107.1 Methylated-DNA-[protein]-cysteine S-methyltransferase [Nitrospira japonica]
MLRATIFRSSWGWVGIAESAKGICAISLPKKTRQEAERSIRKGAGPMTIGRATGGLQRAREQLQLYLSGRRRTFTLPMDVRLGTRFQQRVWRVLRRLPYASLRSYRWVASRVGGPRYARAVGNAVGANPIPIIIPCHRIVAHDVSLGGFSGGLSMKQRLLTLEGTLAELRPRRPPRRKLGGKRRSPAHRTGSA